jgi:hypothetical protein
VRGPVFFRPRGGAAAALTARRGRCARGSPTRPRGGYADFGDAW